MSELSPCPFCGHDTATVFEIDLRGSLPFLAGCTTCGATIGRRETSAEAVEAWNSRPLETVLRETVKKACEMEAASCLTCSFFSDGDNGMTCSNIIYPELYFFNDKDRGRLAHISCPYWEAKEAKS